MNVVCISDTHQLERDVLVPPGDLLVHAGDFSMMRMATQRTLRSFDERLGEQPHRHKVLTCGNHDFEFEREPRLRDQITNGHLLVNSGIEVEGLRIWGSPVTPLAGGAFGIADARERERHWARIPRGTHLLLVHGPPFGILDGDSGTVAIVSC